MSACGVSKGIYDHCAPAEPALVGLALPRLCSCLGGLSLLGELHLQPRSSAMIHSAMEGVQAVKASRQASRSLLCIYQVQDSALHWKWTMQASQLWDPLLRKTLS